MTLENFLRQVRHVLANSDKSVVDNFRTFINLQIKQRPDPVVVNCTEYTVISVED